MGQQSLIEWTEATWNPLTGCSKISLGCKHCYVERLAERLQAMGNPRYRNGFKLTFHSDLLALPLKWRLPKMIFVNSMSDLFHEEVPLNFIKEVFETIIKAEWHIFQILTKRSQRLAELSLNLPWPSNLWIGVSIENQEYIRNVNYLRKVPAKVRFLSCEPLLGPLKLELEGISWVIVGGESGPRARPMKAEWVRDIRDQCLAAGVPFFFKQWGGIYDKKGNHKAILDGRLWQEWPCCYKKRKVHPSGHPLPLFGEEGITLFSDANLSKAIVR